MVAYCGRCKRRKVVEYELPEEVERLLLLYRWKTGVCLPCVDELAEKGGIRYQPENLDATTWHRYAVAWDRDGSRFHVDDQLVRSCDQGTAYPMQLMVDLFEVPAPGPRPAAAYPKLGWVRSVLGWSAARG